MADCYMQRATAHGDGEIKVFTVQIKTLSENPFICWKKQNSLGCVVGWVSFSVTEFFSISCQESKLWVLIKKKKKKEMTRVGRGGHLAKILFLWKFLSKGEDTMRIEAHKGQKAAAFFLPGLQRRMVRAVSSSMEVQRRQSMQLFVVNAVVVVLFALSYTLGNNCYSYSHIFLPERPLISKLQ